MAVSPLQLAHAICAESGWKTSNMRLHKVAYMVNGAHLVEKGAPIVSEEKFQAWRYGPVLPSLYHAFKEFRADNIPEDAAIFEFVKPLKKQTEKYSYIAGIVKQLSDFTAAELVGLTHARGGAWEKTSAGAMIRDDLIKKEFARYVKSEQPC